MVAELNVNITDSANQALSRVSEITGFSRTDCVSRAIMLYEMVCQANLSGEKQMITSVEKNGGETLKLIVLPLE